MTTTDFLKKEVPTLLLLLVPLVALPFLWGRLPAEVPTHWNLRGEPDAYSGKAFGLLFWPSLSAGIYLLYWLIPRIDPKRKIAADRKPLPALRFFTALFFTAFFFVTVFGAVGTPVLSMALLVPLVVLLLTLVMGNYLATVQRNYFIGIRTPWTLEDPEIWRKTHRLGGRLWVATSSVLLVLLLLLDADTFPAFFAVGIGAMVLIPVGYSYYLYAIKKRETGTSS